MDHHEKERIKLHKAALAYINVIECGVTDQNILDGARKALREALDYIPPPLPEDLYPECEDEKPDLTKCPACGGIPDNGHDRECPPNPYICSKCKTAYQAP